MDKENFLYTAEYTNNLFCLLILLQVSIVIHAAATIRFTEKLRIATRINIEATATILDLCKNMQNLKVIKI